MGTLLDAARAFFEQDGWPILQADDPTDDRPVLVSTCQGRHGRWDVAVVADDSTARLVVYSLLPNPAPPPRRPEVAEFLTRANHRLVLGNFELDLGDGEIRFKTSIDVAGDRISTALVRNLVHANVATTDAYLAGLRAVAVGEASAEQAALDAEA
jgi:hypothetical protein